MLSRDQMRTLLGEAAIYAAPARYEPFGLGVLEAAAAGCALVLGDIASLRELWHDAALFVPPDDQRALQDALHTLCSDASLRRQLAARAYQRAQRFPREATASGYLALYQRLVTARGKDPECASSASIIR
jgi:glycosyltransferase involved in cell wall biosynthesis